MGLDASLPPSGRPIATHKPFTDMVTIAGIDDRFEMMASLQAPKKVCAVAICQILDAPFLIPLGSLI